MLDRVSLDQLRTFVAAADEGSFSAAGRKLLRAQSVVSDLIASLEGHFGVTLFERAGRYPSLTPAGVSLLADARNILANVDLMKSRARGMALGTEPELSVVIDVLFPIQAITLAAREFRVAFPDTPLRLYAEALGGVAQTLVDGRAGLGVAGPLPLLPKGLVGERIAAVEMVMVAARDHPLAAVPGVVTRRELARHVQLVLTDRSNLSAGQEFGVMSPQSWRLADLFAKHEFLLNGLGWGGMPLHAVEDDIARGRLVVLSIEDTPPGAMVLPMSAVYAHASPPGPAGRWLIDRLRACPREAASRRGSNLAEKERGVAKARADAGTRVMASAES